MISKLVELGVSPGDQPGHVDVMGRVAGVARDPVTAAAQQCRRSNIVAPQEVSQGDRQLGQALPEITLTLGRRLPGALQDFVGVEGQAFIQQPLSLRKREGRWEDKLVGNAGDP